MVSTRQAFSQLLPWQWWDVENFNIPLWVHIAAKGLRVWIPKKSGKVT